MKADFKRSGGVSLRLWMVTIGAIAMLAVGAPQRASAQVLYGSMIGNVTDPNGAVVPGAAVTATEQNTGVAHTTTTDQNGTYQFVNVQSGTYAIKVAVAGFKTFERRDVSIETNNITRTNVTLEVGDIQQSVTITGESPTLQTDRSEV